MDINEKENKAIKITVIIGGVLFVLMFIFMWSGKWFSPETAHIVRTVIVVSVILAILFAFVVFVCLAIDVSLCHLQRHSLTTWGNYQIYKTKHRKFAWICEHFLEYDDFSEMWDSARAKSLEEYRKRKEVERFIHDRS